MNTFLDIITLIIMSVALQGILILIGVPYEYRGVIGFVVGLPLGWLVAKYGFNSFD